MDEFIKKFKESDQYKKVPVWSNIRIRELQARREHLYFFRRRARNMQSIREIPSALLHGKHGKPPIRNGRKDKRKSVFIFAL